MKRLREGGWRLLTLLVILTGGCDLPGKPREADRPARADQVKGFDALYGAHCAGCHGADGKLGPAPPLNDPLFLTVVPDAELLHVVSEGRSVTTTQRSPMPAFARARGGPLTDAQVQALAEGIKKRWGPAASGEATPPYLSPAGARSGNLDEGARVFARACAGCHGRQGQGGEHGGRPVGAINDPAFLALISDKVLRRTAITGRPDLGMPAYDGTAGRPADFRPLTSAQIDDLVALLASWRQGAPGRRLMMTSVLRKGETMDPVSDPPPSGPALDPPLGRRSFLGWLTYGLGAIAAAAVGLPFIGYVFGVRKAPVRWLSLGRVIDFPQGQTRLVTFDNPIRQPWDGMVAHTGVFVRYEGRDEREADETKAHTFLVLAVNCAHLGCPVEWFQESGLFMCPCHGGVYYANGEHAAGPPPRGLYRCVCRVTRADGVLQLEIQAPHFPTRQDTLEQG